MYTLKYRHLCGRHFAASEMERRL
uniref:Uncharacterized protein n=1 Tax=Tetranychus urticae TaxID=32264 RepID=T1K6N4_TETUR